MATFGFRPGHADEFVRGLETRVNRLTSEYEQIASHYRTMQDGTQGNSANKAQAFQADADTTRQKGNELLTLVRSKATSHGEQTIAADAARTTTVG